MSQAGKKLDQLVADQDRALAELRELLGKMTDEIDRTIQAGGLPAQDAYAAVGWTAEAVEGAQRVRGYLDLLRVVS